MASSKNTRQTLSRETIERPAGARDEGAAAGSPKLHPALVILWSMTEADRAGEVLSLRAARTAILGRFDPDYDYGESAFVAPLRQRPGKNEERAPLEFARHISRRQLELVGERGGRVRVKNLGKAPLRVNGELSIESGAGSILEVGDTLAIGDEVLLLCQPRPIKLDAPRFLPTEAWPAFGAADSCGIVGESLAVWQLRDRLAFVAQMSQHALVTGPTGSGKELAAQAIHSLSARSKRPLVAHSAADIPPTLVEAELFGNRANYPNAGMPGREGLIGAADGSTLFLDELGMLPTDLQAKLLRVLDEQGTYRRLGVDEPQRSDFRLVGATNRPLEFIKSDLLARLKHVIALPPLTERAEDVPLLAAHLLARMAAREGEGAIVRRLERDGRVPMSLALIDALARHLYNANLRELEQLLLSALYGSGGDEVGLSSEVEAQLRFAARREAVDPEEVSCDVVRSTLEECDWNISRAAGQLGWSRFQLNRKMKKCGIEGRG
ncbi:MAG: sigma 54-interacting transcriptional regulator [Candidatus Eisenbacteria bacterium]